MITQIWQWLTAPEQWSGSRGIPTRLLEHLGFSALSLLLAAAIAIPVGLWVGHTGRGRSVVTIANAARAVPSLGLLFAVAMFVGPRITSNLAFVIPRNAEKRIHATRLWSVAPASVHHRPARHSRNKAWAPWITRDGAMRSHKTPANQPNTMELPNDKPKPTPDNQSEPTFSCRYRMTV